MDYSTAVLTFALHLAHSMFPQVDLRVPAMETAIAVIQATQDPEEAETLLKIAAQESGFSTDVRTCKIMGDHNDARGPFQIHRSWLIQIGEGSRVKSLCDNDMIESAKIALETIHTSQKYCAKFGMKGADLLGAYVSGKCIANNPVARSHYGSGKEIWDMMLRTNPRLTSGKGMCVRELDNRSGFYDD